MCHLLTWVLSYTVCKICAEVLTKWGFKVLLHKSTSKHTWLSLCPYIVDLIRVASCLPYIYVVLNKYNYQWQNKLLKTSILTSGYRHILLLHDQPNNNKYNLPIYPRNHSMINLKLTQNISVNLISLEYLVKLWTFSTDLCPLSLRLCSRWQLLCTCKACKKFFRKLCIDE